MKHCKPLLTLGILIAGGAGFWASEALAKDVIELKTYYPSPSGIYDTLRVAPRSVSPDCSHDYTGTYYYDSDGIYDLLLGHNSPAGVYVCNGSEWVAMGGGDSLWKEDDTATLITPTDSTKKIDAPSGAKIGKVEDVECGSDGKGEGLIRYNKDKHLVEFCDNTGTWHPAFSKTIVGACTTVGGPSNCWGFANDAGNVCLKGTKLSMDSAYAGLESPNPVNFICVLGQDTLNGTTGLRIIYRNNEFSNVAEAQLECDHATGEKVVGGGCFFETGNVLESWPDNAIMGWRCKRTSSVGLLRINVACMQGL